MGSRSNGQQSVTILNEDGSARSREFRSRDSRHLINEQGNVHHRPKRTDPSNKCKCGKELKRSKGKRYCLDGHFRF